MQHDYYYQIRELIYDSSPSCINFLIGENGSGKSRLLAELGKQILKEDHEYNLLAISNSPYTKFSSRSIKNRYQRQLLGNKLNSPSKLIKGSIHKTLLNTDIDLDRILNLSKILSYLNISTEIGFALSLSRENILEIGHIFLKENSNYNLYSNEKNKILLALREAEVNFWESRENYYKNNNKNDYKIIENNEINTIAINYYQNNIELIDEVLWIDFKNPYMDSRFEILKSLISLESTPRSRIKINVLARNSEGYTFLLDSMSSGESSLFCTFSFLHENITEKTWILIDEPENSLHPKWQRDYCNNILNNFYYFNPRIIIATHSPMIVSGAASENIQGNVYLLKNNELTRTELSDGIEGILMEAFDTITPKNHYLSEQANHLLKKLEKNEISLQDAIHEIDFWEKKSYDENQKKFLNQLKKLAQTINNR